MMPPDFSCSIPATYNETLEQKVMDRLNDLTKPRGSLGRLEEFALRYCLCKGESDARLQSMQVFTFAGDHGISREKITPFPPEVTPQMVYNMANGGAAVSVMCRNAGIGYSVIDIGVNADFGDIPGLIRKKVCRGTRNFKNEPAMTRAECGQALQVGYEIGTQVKADLVGAGEMGIGNSSSASALYSLLLGIDPAITVGQGTGSYGELLEKKKRIIAEAVALHKTQWNNDPFDALRRVGGLEIAGITGLIFGCATQRIPVAVDGFIASSAALTALRMNPAVREYLFFSHKSAESFHADFLTGEGIRPVLDLEMRLGEGTGAVLAMQIISQAMACYRLMATFSGAGVSGEKK